MKDSNKNTGCPIPSGLTLILSGPMSALLARADGNLAEAGAAGQDGVTPKSKSTPTSVTMQLGIEYCIATQVHEQIGYPLEEKSVDL